MSTRVGKSQELSTMNCICSRLYIHNYFYVVNPCGTNHGYNKKKHVHRLCSVTHLWKSWQRWQNTLKAFAACVLDYMTQRNEGKGTVLALSSPTSATALLYIDRWWWYNKSFIKPLILSWKSWISVHYYQSLHGLEFQCFYHWFWSSKVVLLLDNFFLGDSTK